MKKLILTALLALGLTPLAASALEPLRHPLLQNGPWLQHATPTGMVVMWETATECDAEVLYGETVPLPRAAKTEGRARIHEVALADLVPETGYFYRVRSKCGPLTVQSPVYTFSTAVRAETPFAFAAMGDNQTNVHVSRRIFNRIYAERPNFVLAVGDEVGDGQRKFLWTREFLRPGAALMRRVPVWVAIGNHEDNAHWFYDYHSYPQPENYYSFDYGSAHFAMIDSNLPLDPSSAEYQWLETDLAASTALWKFVCHHHAPYSSDNDDYGDTRREKSTLGDDKVRQLTPLYERYGVDMVFYGHIHDYERTHPLLGGKYDPRGVIYVQTGGAGGGLEDYAPNRSPFTAKVMRGHHFCMVTVAGARLEFQAIDIDGKVFDRFEIGKEGKQ